MDVVADKLREARALIERGWVQGVYARGDCVCVYGAVQKAVLGDASDDSHGVRTIPLERYLIDSTGADDLAAWNDTPGRTQAEVLAAFDKAIELAEAQS